jgi:hypothetical protein
MRRIDLFCKLAGPLFVSLLTIRSLLFTALFLAGSNLVSLHFEYHFIRLVHKRFLDLAVKTLSPAQISQPLIRQIVQLSNRTISSWKTYYSSPLFAASLSLCILYSHSLQFRRYSHCFQNCISIAVLQLLNPPYRWFTGNCSHRRN